MDNLTILWFLFGAASVCSFMIGRAINRHSQEKTIEVLLDWLVDNNMVKTKKVNGELELIPLNED